MKTIRWKVVSRLKRARPERSPRPFRSFPVANVGRFLELVDQFTDNSQFIIITHNKQTMAKSEAIFGVTQQERGVSQLVSVKFEDVDGTSAA